LPQQKRLPKVFSHAEIFILLEHIESEVYRICFLLMYVCGLRISEAVSLQVEQINSENNTLQIIGKGDRERLVPVPDSMLTQLRQQWLTHRHPRFLFPNKSGGNSIATSSLTKAFRSGLQLSKLKQQDATPHALRHSYGTRLMEHGVDIALVSKLLGHSSIKSTIIYTHLTAHSRKQVQEIITEMMQL